jgi:hypothetical protein
MNAIVQRKQLARIPQLSIYKRIKSSAISKTSSTNTQTNPFPELAFINSPDEALKRQQLRVQQKLLGDQQNQLSAVPGLRM